MWRGKRDLREHPLFGWRGFFVRGGQVALVSLTACFRATLAASLGDFFILRTLTSCLTGSTASGSRRVVCSPCTTPTPIISSELSVTSEFTAAGSPTPAPIGPPETPSSGKIFSSAPTTARCRAYSFIGIVPAKPRRRRQVSTWWGFFGAHLALSCLECIWLWDLGGLIPLF